jgi:hypothetical protein
MEGSMERRQLYTPVVLAVVALLPGCGDARSPVHPTAPPVMPALEEFRLTGGVTDTAYRPLSGARVEVINGLRAGTVATTDEAGRFSMTGTFTGTTTVIASKDGYLRDSRTVPLGVSPLPLPGGGNWDLAFHLEPLGPSPNIAGVYTLTMTADSACTSLPNEARMRTYTATIVPIPGSRTSFRATLSDARFFSTYNRALIATAGDFAQFSLCISDPSQSYCFPGIVEQLRETTYVAIEGGAEGLFDAAGITARFAGSFQYCPSETGLTENQYECLASARVQCESHNHQLTLFRR